MKGLLIFLGILLFLLLLPIGARVIYNEKGVTVQLVLGLIRFRIVPGKPKPPEDPAVKAEKKRKKKLAAQEKKKKKELKKLQTKEKPKKSKKKEPLGAKIKEFLPFVKLGLQALGDLRKLFTVHKLKLRITYGGGDAASAAMNYGVAWGICGAGMSLLTKALRIRRYDVEPVLDYDCKDTRIVADAVVMITLWRVFGYLFTYGFRAVKLLMDKKNAKKVKAVQHESSNP